MSEQFDNIDRSRYYGLRVGDLVVEKAFDMRTEGVVTAYTVNNNVVKILTTNGNTVNVVAEWCLTQRKVEDRLGDITSPFTDDETDNREREALGLPVFKEGK